MQDNPQIEKKILDHDHNNKCNTTQEFDNLTVVNFAGRIKQAKLATKSDIADFVKKTDFNDKLKCFNKKVTLNKTRHVEAEKKLNDLREIVAQTSRKGFEFSLGKMYFTGDDGYQNFFFEFCHNR